MGGGLEGIIKTDGRWVRRYNTDRRDVGKKAYCSTDRREVG